MSDLTVDQSFEGYMIENEASSLAFNGDDGFPYDVWKTLESLKASHEVWDNGYATQKVYKVHITIVEMVKDSDSE